MKCSLVPPRGPKKTVDEPFVDKSGPSRPKRGVAKHMESDESDIQEVSGPVKKAGKGPESERPRPRPVNVSR